MIEDARTDPEEMDIEWARWVWVPGSTRFGILSRSDPGKTDLFSSAAVTLEESNRIIS